MAAIGEVMIPESSTNIYTGNIDGLPSIPDGIKVNDNVEITTESVNVRDSVGVARDNLVGSIGPRAGTLKIVAVDNAWVKVKLDVEVWVYGGYVRKV
jgi:hypothetical protein